MSVDEIRKGPNTIDGPAPGRWTVIRAKSAGVAPGFTVRDEKGEVWFLTFDARGQPDRADGRGAVATRLFWALGYNQVESYLRASGLKTWDRRRRDHSGPRQTAAVHARGRRRRARPVGEEARTDRTESSPAAAVPGRTLGGFRYYGTRPDDPNDIVPHEHRRELRALQVFGAWTNLVDMKAGNTLDTLITENGRGIVRHYLQDVGSTFGTGALAPTGRRRGIRILVRGWSRRGSDSSLSASS